MSSRVAQLLAEKRAAQIRRMNGEEDVDDSKVDAELAEMSSRRRKGYRPRKPKSRSLKFSDHARKRMAQRRMDAKVVYAIWRVGEEVSQPGDRRAYVVTRKSLEAATREDAQDLESWCGCAIVVVDLPKAGPLLVTVLAAGEDTRVTGFDERR